ncbi:uncharacterized protein LOC109809352 [Cajanus cajan]|uniref:uncharacterized protein LOC109809352 n=1 Tax=Cajanus cajan TaxID=3821 RepID=UPI00098D7D2E|nr:uncharacterized protein LOC109809352 [Cajanus cajan]
MEVGWTILQNRSKGHNGRTRRKEHYGLSDEKGRNQEHLTSFFFTNFLRSYGAKEMWHEFSRHVNIKEVFISVKVDKRGERLGFARFSEVKDARIMALTLDKIFIQGRKIMVNRPRFQKGVWEKKQVNVSRRHRIEANERKPAFQQRRWDPGAKKGAEQNEGRTKSSRPSVDCIFKACPKVKEGLERSFVGRVKRKGDAYITQKKLHLEGIFGIRATLMGASMVLLETEDPKLVAKYISDKVEWVNEWFEEVFQWSRILDNERLVWLKIYGVPAHGWSEDFFKMLGSIYEKFLYVDDPTKDRVRLDLARLAIRTNIQDILNHTVRVEIDGVIYQIRIAEEGMEISEVSYDGRWLHGVEEVKGAVRDHFQSSFKKE